MNRNYKMLKKVNKKLGRLILIFVLINSLILTLFFSNIPANIPPSGVILLSPTNQAYLNDSTPLLTWYPSYDADGSPLRYEIEVDEYGGDWSSLVAYNITAFYSTSWVVTPSLTNNQTYQWRVRADDGLGQTNSTGPWSPVWSFTIDFTAPTLLDGSADIEVVMGEKFTVYVNYTDNTDLTTSTIFYKKATETQYQSQLMIEFQGSNNFSIPSDMLGINTSLSDENYFYYIVSYDLAKNQFVYSKGTSQDFQITVNDDKKPEVIYGTGNFTVTTDDEFTIFINSYDNVGISIGTLYIRKIGSNWQSILMNSYPNPGYFIINYTDLRSGLGINTSDGINLEYYVLVQDPSSNVGNYSTPVGLPWQIQVVDNDPPTIIEGSGNIYTIIDNKFTIYANFSDNVGITKADLYLRDLKDVSGTWNSVPMPMVAPDCFALQCPDNGTTPGWQFDTSTSGNYQYYILANDAGNNYCNYTQSQSAPWTITVTDDEGPTFISGSGNFMATTDDQFIIYANFSDDINVATAKIYLSYIKENTDGTYLDWHETWMMKQIDGTISRFSISYDILKSGLGIDTTHGGKLGYYIVASDQNSNSIRYPAVTNEVNEIIIVDNDAPQVLDGSIDFIFTIGSTFSINVNLFENIELNSVTLYYAQLEPDATTVTVDWTDHEIQPELISEEYRLYGFTVTSDDLGIDTLNNYLDYLYYVTATDDSDNTATHGTSTNPFKITVIDNSLPELTNLIPEPFVLDAKWNDDLVIEAEVFDVGSGFNEQSVLISYKRGNFDEAFLDFTPMQLIDVYTLPDTKAKIVSNWEFTIPRPQTGHDDISQIDGWELIVGQEVSIRLLFSDVEGNEVESDVYTMLVNEVEVNHAPEIKLIAPVGNENFSNLQYIFWSASDIDNDPLFITIEISNDNGQTWDLLVAGFENTGFYLMNTTSFTEDTTYLIKITAYDGELSDDDSSETTFTISRTEFPDGEEDGELSSVDDTEIIPLVIAGIILALIVASAGFIGGTEVGKFKFYSLILIPLYTRLHHDEVLDHFIRGQIYGYIKANPGEHYNAIKESLELNNGTLSHHLKILEKEEYIYSKRDKFYSRFYPKGMKITPLDAAQLNKIQKIIVNKIRERPGLTQNEIITILGASQQVVSYNLTKLARDNVLKIVKEGREKRYFINNVEVEPKVSEVEVTPPPQPAVQAPAQQTNTPAPAPTSSPMPTAQPSQSIESLAETQNNISKSQD